MKSDEITPSKERVEALRGEVGPGPVVMLNPLKFRQPDGRARFAEYGALISPLSIDPSGVVYRSQRSARVATEVAS